MSRPSVAPFFRLIPEMIGLNKYRLSIIIMFVYMLKSPQIYPFFLHSFVIINTYNSSYRIFFSILRPEHSFPLPDMSCVTP
ncbi:hypothetical protein BC830DRAFT_1111291 [Chytriomyces sp. MP71]|nr:hypothetical protein BC830DRAFT_1111291 [Chytriomyces sp. MP71]